MINAFKKNQARALLILLIITLWTCLNCVKKQQPPTEPTSAHAFRSENQPLYILMLGAPGSGKGTQAGLLSQKYHIPQLSTGDLLRASVKSGTAMGKKVATLMNQGKLVSDEIVDQILSTRFLEADCQKGFILDGYPRTLEQAKSLDSLLEKLPKGQVHILHLEIQEEEVIHRIQKRATCAQCNLGKVDQASFSHQCGSCRGDEVVRGDDQVSVAQQRLKIYRQYTRPVIDFYQTRKEFKSLHSSTSTQTFEGIVKLIETPAQE